MPYQGYGKGSEYHPEKFPEFYSDCVVCGIRLKYLVQEAQWYHTRRPYYSHWEKPRPEDEAKVLRWVNGHIHYDSDGNRKGYIYGGY